VIVPHASIWALPDELTNFIISALFKQTLPDFSALVRGCLPNGQTYAWLYTADRYYPISLDDHAKFREAAKSRGGDYSLEICEFKIEEQTADGDIVINYWRHIGDESGSGGRVLLSHKLGAWKIAQPLKGGQKLV
jgi:hypothetical protein